MANQKKTDLQKFLEGVKQKKKEQLFGVVLDMGYWDKVLKDNKAEDELRSALKEEQEKEEKSQDRIDDLNAKIDAVSKANKELANLNNMRQAIEMYIEHVNNPDEKTKKELDRLNKRQL